MGEFDGNNGDRSGPREPPDPTMFAGMPPGGYEPHPLFPRDDDSPEDRDICYLTFRRKRSDGRIDNCPEDIPAGEIQSWADVTGPWGGGEYKAIGKDRRHRIVAWYPPKNGEWLLFDQESKPFTLRNGHRYSPAVAPPAAPAPAPPPSPPQPPSPPAPSPTETLMLEVLRELRTQRTNPPAAPASAGSGEAVLIAMINAQGEMARAALTAALSQRPAEGSTTVVELLKVMREWAPQAQAQGSMSERLGEYKQIRELTTPAAVMPPPSELGELKDMFMSVLQADAMSKTTAREDPPPSPPPVERRPPPRRALCYVPGIGMVDEADVNAILSDPMARARVRNALGVGAGVSAGVADTPAMSAPMAPPPASWPMAAGPAHVHPASAAPSPPPAAPIPAPVLIATTPAPPVPSASMPAPPPAPSIPIAPAPMTTAPMTTTAAPNVAVATSAAPTVTSAPAAMPMVDAILRDPVIQARLLALGIDQPAAPAPLADPTPPPAALIPIAPAPVPTAAVPASAPMPAPSEPPTEPSAPAVSDDRRAPIAELVQTAGRRKRDITDDDRIRAVPALRTIARMPHDQARAELSKLPGMDREAVNSFVSVLLPHTDSFSHDTWATFVAGLPADAVRALVDGPGG